MKFLQSLLFIFLLCVSLTAQDAKWTRIETENKEISASLPPNFLVQAEDKKDNQYFRIIGFQNGVKIELVVNKDSDSRGRLSRLPFRNNTTDLEARSFETDKFSGINVVTNKIRYYNSFFLASKEYFYHLWVSAPNEQKPEVLRFLYSIKLAGKPLIVRKDYTEPIDEIVSIRSLKSSPEVIEALNRKTEEINRKISFELDSDSIEPPPNDNIELPILLFQPPPKFIPKFNGKKNDGDRVKIRAQLLANGQIGDIIVYSTEDRSLVNACIEAVKNTKFIPARKDGKPIDYVNTFKFNFSTHINLQIEPPKIRILN